MYRPTEPASSPRTELIAGPPAASPPLAIAFMIVGLSVAGPFIFLRDGTPSLLLGVTAVAVALAGLITMLAAIRAQQRRAADAALRPRVSISPSGVTLHPTPDAADDLHFPRAQIGGAQLLAAAFTLTAGPMAARPGRHVIRFGKLVTPRPDIISALEAMNTEPPGSR